MSRKLSIIVPVYNVEPYVGKTLASVFDTPAPAEDFEVIVVNDGTKDGSMAVVRQFADRPNLTIIEQENQGLSAARTKGLSVASGEYVWFVDSDDQLVEDGVGKVLKKLADSPDADALMFPIRWFYVDGSPDFLDYRLEGEHLVKGMAVLRDYHLPPWIVPRFVFRRSMAENAWLFFPEGLWHEDEYYGPVLLCLADRVRVLGDPVYNYVQRPGSIVTSRKIRTAYDLVSIHGLLIRFMEGAPDSLDKEWFRQYCLDRLLSIYRRFSDRWGSPEFRRFAWTRGTYIWREWVAVHPDASWKRKLGRLFYFRLPAWRQRLLGRKSD